METDVAQTLDADIYGLEIRMANDGRTISGIAVPYDQESPYMKEKFARDSVSLADNVPILLGHNHNEPIGLITRGWHEKDGFHFEGRVSDTAKGNESVVLAKDGVLKVSAGFIPKLIGRSADGVNEIKSAIVHEISLVAIPAYKQASITEVRNAPEPEILASADSIKEEETLVLS